MLTSNSNNSLYFDKILNTSILIVGVAMTLYHLVSVHYIILGVWGNQNAHLGFSLLLINLVAMKQNWSKSILHKTASIILILVSILVTTYIGIFGRDLEMRALHNTTIDLFIGVLLVLIVLISSWRTFGFVLPMLAATFIAYALLGPYLPLGLRTAVMPLDRLIAQLGIGFRGIFGDMLALSADSIFLFILLGVLLQTSGATGFFEEISKIVGRIFKAGEAMSAVVTSALLGMTTGSIAANIITSGSFTIPAMKKAGYSPEQAGAIEAAASSGGQIMPPIMGAAALLMAGITGIPYVRIMLAALIPALLYFFMVGMYVYLQAIKRGVKKGSVEPLNKKEMFLRMPLFVVPLSLVIYFLIKGYSLNFSAFWSITACVGLALLRKETRGTIRSWLAGFTKAAEMGAQIAVSVSTIGIIVSIVTLTGLGIKLPMLVEAWSGGNVIIALLITTIACIILGMGTATVAVYLLVAIIVAPILVKLGIPLLIAHFFVFYYACFSFLTPPVAVGALIASKIAGGTYIKTSIESVKAALIGFIMPFIIVWNPILLFIKEPEKPLFLIAANLTVSIIAVIALQLVLMNQYIISLTRLEGFLLGLTTVGIIVYFVANLPILAIAGTSLFIVVTISQYLRMPKKITNKNWGGKNNNC